MALRGCSWPLGLRERAAGWPASRGQNPSPKRSANYGPGPQSTLQGVCPAPPGRCLPTRGHGQGWWGGDGCARALAPGRCAPLPPSAPGRACEGARRGGSLRAAAGASWKKGAALGLRRRKGAAFLARTHPEPRGAPTAPGLRAREAGGWAGAASREPAQRDRSSSRRTRYRCGAVGARHLDDLTAHPGHPPTQPDRAHSPSQRSSQQPPVGPGLGKGRGRQPPEGRGHARASLLHRPTAPNPAPPAVSGWGDWGGRA